MLSDDVIVFRLALKSSRFYSPWNFNIFIRIPSSSTFITKRLIKHFKLIWPQHFNFQKHYATITRSYTLFTLSVRSPSAVEQGGSTVVPNNPWGPLPSVTWPCQSEPECTHIHLFMPCYWQHIISYKFNPF